MSVYSVKQMTEKMMFIFFLFFYFFFQPTPCHYFLRLLDEKKKLLKHFTQVTFFSVTFKGTA